MAPNTFQNQIKRLKDTYGDRAYGEERCKIMWRTFQHEKDDVFIEAVDDLIMNNRSTPLHAEFDDAIKEARRRDHERRNMPIGLGNITDIFNHAVKVTDANRDLVNECKKLLFDFQVGKLTKSEFLTGCDMLDKAAAAIKKGSSK